MKKYIEKEVIQRAISIYLSGQEKDPVSVAKEILSDIQLVDAEQVIRCKYCRYYTKQKNVHRCGLTNYVVRSEDYCSYAEEKDK